MRVELTLDNDLVESLRHRVQKGESSTVDALILSDLRYCAEMANPDEKFLAGVAEAYDEIESDPNSGIPIEDVMRRFGMTNPGGRQPIS